jgi:very-short-patch-repair endonuclease
MLRDFLHYAETGKMAAGQVTFGEFDSPFEEAVAIVLRDRGYKVEPQVGVSGFRIDLGILHPEHPGKFILGIECDGAAYHSSRSARDRDRLRQQVLEGLGWRLYRIWSTDWFRRKTKETERLIKAVEEALKLQAARRTQVPFTVPLKIKSEPTKALHVEVSNFRDFEPEPKPQFSSSDPKPKNQSVEALVEPYREYTTRSFKGMQLEDLAGCNLVEIVVNIVHHEGPIHLEEVARRLRQAFGLGRTGNRILSIVEVALKKAAENGALLREGEFWFRVGKTLEKPRSRRDAAAPLRRADRIAPQEYRLAIQAVLRQAFSVEREEMSALVARLLGFDRTGNGLDRAISEEIDHMLKMGLLQDADGRLENRN